MITVKQLNYTHMAWLQEWQVPNNNDIVK